MRETLNYFVIFTEALNICLIYDDKSIEDYHVWYDRFSVIFAYINMCILYYHDVLHTLLPTCSVQLLHLWAKSSLPAGIVQYQYKWHYQRGCTDMINQPITTYRILCILWWSMCFPDIISTRVRVTPPISQSETHTPNMFDRERLG